MSGASVGCSPPSSCPGMTPFRRCRKRGEKKSAVFIDVDNDNVIIIDVPESSERTLRPPNVLRKDRKNQFPRTGVICLDDDENTSHRFANSSVKHGSYFNSGASSSTKSPTQSGCLGKSSDTFTDECEFIRENVPPVKLSKCKRTYSGKTSARNRYGIGTDSDSCPSDSDNADCELVEDSFGRVREEWEKASSRRKCDTRNAQPGIGEPGLVFEDNSQNVNPANDCGQRKEPLFEGVNDKGKEAHAPSEENDNVDFNFFGKQTCNLDNDYGLESISRRLFNADKDGSLYRINPLAEGPSLDYAKCISGRPLQRGGMSTCREQEVPNGSSSSKYEEHNTSQVNHMEKNFQGRQRSPPREPCLSKEEAYAGKANISETYISHSEDSVRNDVDGGRSNSEATVNFYQVTSSTFNPDFQWNSYQELNTTKEKFASEKASSLIPGSSKKHIDNGSCTNDGKEELVEDCIISGREKLKETEEYKRAIEEEMSSRQRVLQIQAEEAQRMRRLRKRLKAESMRLLDMERRQKQRVEEIRETQKKDVENMNLKEVIRARVMRELNQLEVRCHDMASLLRGLGIIVGNSANPSLDEVRSAYKRALLAFHPDRASRSDIGQQVEAEEKFKLISRMKEKFLPT